MFDISQLVVEKHTRLLLGPINLYAILTAPPELFLMLALLLLDKQPLPPITPPQ